MSTREAVERILPGHEPVGACHLDSEEIVLPRTDRPAEPAAATAVLAASLGGSETILIVEDQDQVRALARAILTRHGYSVLEARSGDEALAICQRHAKEIDLVVTDVVMPRMSGRQLTERLVGLRSDTRVLFMSGYPDHSIVQHGVLEKGIAFLPKPLLLSQWEWSAALTTA